MQFAHSLFFNEQCERIAQVAHQTWAMWANCSGSSPKMSEIRSFLANRSYSLIFCKKLAIRSENWWANPQPRPGLKSDVSFSPSFLASGERCVKSCRMFVCKISVLAGLTRHVVSVPGSGPQLCPHLCQRRRGPGKRKLYQTFFIIPLFRLSFKTWKSSLSDQKNVLSKSTCLILFY